MGGNARHIQLRPEGGLGVELVVALRGEAGQHEEAGERDAVAGAEAVVEATEAGALQDDVGVGDVERGGLEAVDARVKDPGACR